ncbi:DUF192 domain-containing protein [Flagellimonas sp. CMM7]|uniref:DUF192 domain-containing protein n=1 Tax=Flagellimonas sp. CMM7 TaxID=2654676 RepID=UPI0013D272FB|nr:DUF192 domain-containing protein [Flagellimonas sp. CMM7]UII78659.1 DUF192 domain-containing protein [Flagellimonas sp. CMM7]
MRTLFTILFIPVLLLQSCKTESKKEIKTEAISFTKEGVLTILKQETDSILTHLDIEIAESEYETQTGLMYRESMQDNQGMLFIFPDVAMHSFYMKNTQIALDIIYIDENLKIASFQKNAQPFNETGLSSKVPVKYVLEINAGLSEKLELDIGDTISFTKE